MRDVFRGGSIKRKLARDEVGRRHLVHGNSIGQVTLGPLALMEGIVGCVEVKSNVRENSVFQTNSALTQEARKQKGGRQGNGSDGCKRNGSDYDTRNLATSEVRRATTTLVFLGEARRERLLNQVTILVRVEDRLAIFEVDAVVAARLCYVVRLWAPPAGSVLERI